MFDLDKSAPDTLRDQLKQQLIQAIITGGIDPLRRLPSSRALSARLGVARNTVAMAYDDLIDSGYLVSRPRSGIYVNPDVMRARIMPDRLAGRAVQPPDLEWERRLKIRPLAGQRYRAPPGWQRYPYTFVDGLFEPSLFPVQEWREANRLTQAVQEIHRWTGDTGDADDPKLIEEIRTKILGLRGIQADPEQILITAGAQQGFHLISESLVDKTTTVAIEQPGNPDMHQVLRLRTDRFIAQPIDQDGMRIDDALNLADLVCVSSGNHRTTGATLSAQRREALIARAEERDFLILEDDSAAGLGGGGAALASLYAHDTGRRTIYVGGFGRALTSALRLGFVVGAPALVRRVRQLRHLTTKYPPLNNQRTLAHFLSLGHFDVMMIRYQRAFDERMTALRDALNHYLHQEVRLLPAGHGTSYWIEGPVTLDADRLVAEAETQGILIEPSPSGQGDPANLFRLGVTGIPTDRIRDGVAKLARIVRDLTAGDRRGHIATGPDFLTGRALRRAMANATLLYRTVYGDPCTIEVKPDGRLIGRAGYANEDQDEGNWWIEGDFWVRRWRNWAYGEPGRYRVQVQGDRITWFDAERTPVDSAVIERAAR